MSADRNFGLASPRVRLLSKLPRVVRKTQAYNFDVTAFQWNAINNSPFLSPLLTENVINPERTFAVCFPSKRKFFVDNMLFYDNPATGQSGTLSSSGSNKSGFPVTTNATLSSPPNRTILWTPVGPPPSASSGSSTASANTASTVGVINDILEEQEFPSYYKSIPVTNPISRTPLLDLDSPPVANATLDEYRGPTWRDSNYKEQSQPEDRKILTRFRNFISGNSTVPGGSSGGGGSTLAPLPSQPPKEEAEKRCVYQERLGDGLCVSNF